MAFSTQNSAVSQRHSEIEIEEFRYLQGNTCPIIDRMLRRRSAWQSSVAPILRGFETLY